MWDQSISWNVRSAEAALVESPENVTLSHYAHAIDYLVYAYLQKGNVTAASQALTEINNIENHQNSFGTAYALAAAPARVWLEQEDWDVQQASIWQLQGWVPWGSSIQIRWI